MSIIDEIHRLNMIREIALRQVSILGMLNEPQEGKLEAACRYRLAQDSWTSAEAAYRKAINELSPEQLMAIVDADRRRAYAKE